MIRFITGKPGGGKGLIAIKEIVDELVNGERPIITNFAVRIHPWVRVSKSRGKRHCKPEIGLKNYLIQEYGKDFDCEKRILILQPEDTKTFYLHRRNCESFIKCPETRDVRTDAIVAFDTSLAVENGGVLYVIDEAWSVYGSRDWQTTGKGVLFYVAQHRKLGDTLLLVTQHTKQVETQLRQVAQDFAVVQNHSKMKIGMFRQPSLFSMAIYSEQPTGASQEPMERRVFKLDKAGLGSCFDTAGGVGLGGGSTADIGEKIKGLPFPFIILGIALLAGGIILAARGSGWLTGSLLTNAFGKHESKSAQSTNAIFNNPVSGFVQSMVPKMQTNEQKTAQADLVEEPVYVTGTFPCQGVGGMQMVTLSDGRSLVVGGGHCTKFNVYEGATVDGKLIPWQQVSLSQHYETIGKNTRPGRVPSGHRVN